MALTKVALASHIGVLPKTVNEGSIPHFVVKFI